LIAIRKEIQKYPADGIVVVDNQNIRHGGHFRYFRSRGQPKSKNLCDCW
jgi:hypothetical protein